MLAASIDDEQVLLGPISFSSYATMNNKQHNSLKLNSRSLNQMPKWSYGD